MANIHKARTGWVIESTGYSEYHRALIAGAVRGRKALVPYTAAPELRGRELDDVMGHTEMKTPVTVGEYIQQLAQYAGDEIRARVLRKGYVIR